MLFPLLIAVLASMLAIIYIEHLKIRRFWAERGIPHLPPWPVLGNFDFILKKNVGEWLRDLNGKLQAPVYGIWVFRQPVLVVADPEIAKRIMLSDSALFRNRYLASGKTDPIGALNIFTVKEPIWSNVRRRLTHVFTASKLKVMHGLLTSKAKATIKRIHQDIDNNKNTELRTLFADYTTDIIGTFLFGVENDAVGTGTSPLRSVTQDFMTFNWQRGLSFYSIFFWPALVDIFRFSFFPKRTVKFFRKNLDSIIEYRTTNNIVNNDFLGVVIKMKKEKLDDGQEFTDDLLAAQAVVMVQGGFDTTAVALTLLIYELAYNPDIQRRLYDELREAKNKNGGADFSFNDYEKLTYMNCVTKETLRRYPAMGWLDRLTSEDYKIDDNLSIPANTPVYVNTLGMHHDPKLFPDPYKFDPDRFLPENQHSIIPYSYLPFGDGPRMCIGKRFAEMSMRYLLCEFVLSMEARPLPGYPLPKDVGYETNVTFQMPKIPLSVECIPRN